jgi:hypothetical protein
VLIALSAGSSGGPDATQSAPALAPPAPRPPPLRARLDAPTAAHGGATLRARAGASGGPLHARPGACDGAGAFLRTGAWRALESPPPPLPAACAPLPAWRTLSALDRVGIAFLCSDPAAAGTPRPRYAWAAAPPCAPPPWRALFAPNRTVWVVGDSMSAQTAFVLYCATARDLGSGPMAPPDFGRFLRVSPRDARNSRVTECASVGRHGARLCYLPAGTDGGATVADALRVAIERGGARATDVALLNSVAWQMRKGPAGDAYQRAVAPALAAVANRSGCPRVFWRETYAQHFPTADGVYQANRSDTSRAAAEACAGVPAAQPPILAEVSAAVGALAAVSVLPTWAITQHLGGRAHPAGRRQSHSNDCTHYCNFAGVIQATLDAFALAAADRL